MVRSPTRLQSQRLISGCSRCQLSNKSGPHPKSGRVIVQRCLWGSVLLYAIVVVHKRRIDRYHTLKAVYGSVGEYAMWYRVSGGTQCLSKKA